MVAVSRTRIDMAVHFVLEPTVRHVIYDDLSKDTYDEVIIVHFVCTMRKIFQIVFGSQRILNATEKIFCLVSIPTHRNRKV